ncbi:MAG: hypothetical protein HXY45_07685 [Syntrophaceae bacterium]|nr:hypothetical protein [Syntrophaceae bacterium]
MNRVHKKTALSQTAQSILAANEEGESFLWGRYEEQLPLCAFTANGLNCRKCFQGPCRINPFGDPPTRGVCGADREQIVMENLFQMTLNGVLETARSISCIQESFEARELPELDSDLPQKTGERLRKQGILPVRKKQLFEVQNGFFSHKGYLSQTLKDLTRLGLIHYGLLKGLAASPSPAKNEFTQDPEGANLFLVGQPPWNHLLTLGQKAREQAGGKKVNLWLQGTRGLPFFPPFPDHGSPEIGLARGVDALILYPNSDFPALEDLARKWKIPILLVGEGKSFDRIAAEAFALALDHQKNKGHVTPLPLSQSQAPEGVVFDRMEGISRLLKAGQVKGILVIWAEPNVKQSFFEKTLCLMESASDQKILIWVGGEAAAQAALLNEELARRMGKKGAKTPEGNLGNPGYLFSWGEIPSLVSFLRGLSPGLEFHQMPLGVAFPELSRASTWATAVGFLALGFAVQVGTQLPFWGSPSLSEVLQRDWPNISGGAFMASPSLPDGQRQAREMISYIQSRSFEK